MVINIQKLIDIGTSFVYSWIPALLILWFLVARKVSTRVIVVLAGFLLGAALSILAGYGNRYASIHWFPGDENPAFFMAVGLVEESVKFVASYLSLFLISRKNWKEDLHKNWLAQALSGSLGFSAAENFVYGIDGQGGIARVVPLIAHTFFAVFWGIGFYKLSLSKNIGKGVLWLFLGLLEGIVLHGIYDCVVSENIIPDPLKVVAWLVVGVAIFCIIYWHFTVIRKLENPDDVNQLGTVQQNTLGNEVEQKPNISWSVLSFFMPGFGHFAGKKEFFTGMSFLALSILGPYLIIRLSLLELANRFNAAEITQQEMLQQLVFVLAFSLLCYFAVGLWAAWEVRQVAKDIKPSDAKKRITAFFPISTLFFVSLMMSFFLPAFERNRNQSKGDNKKVVIKEIPLGITWELEKTPPAPQESKDQETGLLDDSNSIALDKDPNKKPKKFSDEKDSDPSKEKPPSGVANSDSLNRKNLPDKLPETGYIGVQLSEITFQGQTRAYIAFVYPGTSAYRAGLRTGDFVLSVDGKSTEGLDAFEVSRMVRGPLGTSVEIEVYREDEGNVTIKAFRTGTLFSEEEKNHLLNPTIERLRQIRSL